MTCVGCVRPRVMRACGNDVPRAFVALFLFPVSEGFAPDSLFLGGFHRSPLLEYPPTRSSPGNVGGVFATSAQGFFFQGGVFSGHDPSRGKRGHKNLPPRLDVGVAYSDRATPVITEGNERAIERATDRPRPSDCPGDRPRRLGDVPSVRVRKERPRACGRAGASPRAMRARRPPFLDALARTSWCVRSDRGGARARGSGSAPNVDAHVSRRRARGARGGDDGGERCGE